MVKCGVAGCWRVKFTSNVPRDPRLRWMFDTPITLDDGEEIRINICPPHVKEIFGLKETDYIGLEETEKDVRELKGVN
jgi:hypothetical protein